MPKKSSYTTDQLVEAILSCNTIAEVLRTLKLKAAGGNYQTIKNEIRRLELDTSHFTGQGWSKNRAIAGTPRRSLDEMLRADSPCSSWNLKKRLFKANMLDQRCYRCGLSDWLGHPIALELEHVNGDHNDNRIENLTILCPNCHALTPTYRGRNIARMV